MEVEGIVLSEISQNEEDKYQVDSLLRGIKETKQSVRQNQTNNKP